jgi:hypothetical protein
MRITMESFSEWDHPSAAPRDDDENDIAWPKTPADFLDRLGFRIGVLVLFVALLLAGLWVLNGPSFQKCSELKNAMERDACYAELRDELFKPPAK